MGVKMEEMMAMTDLKKAEWEKEKKLKVGEILKEMMVSKVIWTSTCWQKATARAKARAKVAREAMATALPQRSQSKQEPRLAVMLSSVTTRVLRARTLMMMSRTLLRRRKRTMRNIRKKRRVRGEQVLSLLQLLQPLKELILLLKPCSGPSGQELNQGALVAVDEALFTSIPITCVAPQQVEELL